MNILLGTENFAIPNKFVVAVHKIWLLTTIWIYFFVLSFVLNIKYGIMYNFKAQINDSTQTISLLWTTLVQWVGDKLKF